MWSESYKVVGRVVRMLPDNRVLIEAQEDLAVGEMIRFSSVSNELLPNEASKVISRMEDEEGQTVYRAGGRVVLESDLPLNPGDRIEKLQETSCFRVEALIEPVNICFLNGLLEGHGDMAVLRTLDGSLGLVEIIGTSCYREEIDELLHSLQEEMPLEVKAVMPRASSILL